MKVRLILSKYFLKYYINDLRKNIFKSPVFLNKHNACLNIFLINKTAIYKIGMEKLQNTTHP